MKKIAKIEITVAEKSCSEKHWGGHAEWKG